MSDAGARARLDLYRHATAENADEYLALMRLFTGTLLADLSAAEAAELLADTGGAGCSSTTRSRSTADT